MTSLKLPMMISLTFALVLTQTSCSQDSDLAPDIRSVKADLVVPKLVTYEDAKRLESLKPSSLAGIRCKRKLAGDGRSKLEYVIYYPANFEPTKKYPVIVELAGNGGYKNKFGDVSDGTPEGSNLGYGLSGGKDFIWVCVPFVGQEEATGDPAVATWWWGTHPKYDPKPTVAYCQSVVDEVCEKHGGDRNRVVLAGFSRGAIACNFIGLHDDEIASRWCGFIAFSHYDGVRDWLPDSRKQDAITRLKRLGDRPQLICSETPRLSVNVELDKTRKWIESTQVEGDFTFLSTGFRNHNDAWVLRPSPARKKLRTWLANVVGSESSKPGPAESGE